MMKQFFVYILMMVGVSSCFSPPDFPDKPSIAFRSISGNVVEEDELLGNTLDSITMSIDFKDGDGDLGLNSNDTLPPFQPFLPDTIAPDGNEVLNPFHHNYRAHMKRRKGAIVENIIFSNGGVSRDGIEKGRFPRLSDEQGPIEGTLNYGFKFPVGRAGTPLRAGDTIFFIIQIIDRAKNISNEVQTAPIVLGDYD